MMSCVKHLLCSVFVMPSRFGIEANGVATGEGFGIVYLEAALAGRASIAAIKAVKPISLLMETRAGSFHRMPML